ncbi:MAG: hypothetical protein C5B49_09705 [Bdellovibrio sp.]|nr:MAG: hypothetical protein C5B49_09705 [Bdellovibrio sp.]
MNPPKKGDPGIQRGSIIIYRVYDVCEEINLVMVEKCLANHKGPLKFNVPKFIDRALVVRNPPLQFGLGDRSISICGKEFRCEVRTKIRDFGVVSIVLEVSIPPQMRWSGLVELGAALEEGSEVDELTGQILPGIVAAIRPAMQVPNPSILGGAVGGATPGGEARAGTDLVLFEDYIVYLIETFVEELPIDKFLSEVDVASLILAEHEVTLSQRSRDVALENIFQYGEKDLAVVDWNSALVIEPGGGHEIPDILEFAVTQLLEMRYYDDLINEKLKDLYGRIGDRGRGFLTNRYGKLYKEASARFIEFTEFLERVENSLKVVGDFYLATIYRAATRKFRLSDWQNSVTRKINILGQVSSLLQGEVNNRRSQLMELVIALLILYEVIAAVMK